MECCDERLKALFVCGRNGKEGFFREGIVVVEMLQVRFGAFLIDLVESDEKGFIEELGAVIAEFIL